MMRSTLALHGLWLGLLLGGCGGDASGPDAAGGTDTVSDSADGGTGDASTPECDEAHPCGVGSYCKTGGVCCPAFGCAPQCPNGRAVDAKGCETCSCAP